MIFSQTPAKFRCETQFIAIFFCVLSNEKGTHNRPFAEHIRSLLRRRKKQKCVGVTHAQQTAAKQIITNKSSHSSISLFHLAEVFSTQRVCVCMFVCV